LQSVLRIAHATGRRAGLLGRSLENMYRCALANDYLHPDFRPISHEHLEYLPEYEVLALATGSQGEVGAALHKLALDTHPHLSLGEGDTVIFSAKTIPGNEAAVARLVENLQARNIAVIHGDSSKRVLHASGHPCQDELIDLYQSLRPDLVIPVHGEAEHMTANANLAKANGAAAAMTGRNGDLFHLAPIPGVKRKWAETGRLEWLENDHRLIPA
jgi:ribonuclease J